MGSFLRQIGLLVTAALLVGGAAPLHAADEPEAVPTSVEAIPPEQVVVVRGSVTCEAVSPKHARTLADDARRERQYLRAAECYRLAGDLVAADRVMAKAFVAANADNTRKASATVDEAKAQARRIREAFRGRPEPRAR